MSTQNQSAKLIVKIFQRRNIEVPFVCSKLPQNFDIWYLTEKPLRANPSTRSVWERIGVLSLRKSLFILRSSISFLIDLNLLFLRFFLYNRSLLLRIFFPSILLLRWLLNRHLLGLLLLLLLLLQLFTTFLSSS